MNPPSFEDLRVRLERDLDRFTTDTFHWERFRSVLQNGQMDRLDDFQDRAIKESGLPEVAKLWTAMAVMAPADDPNDPRHGAAKSWVSKQSLDARNVAALVPHLMDLLNHGQARAAAAIAWLVEHKPPRSRVLEQLLYKQVDTDNPNGLLLDRLLTAFGDRNPSITTLQGGRMPYAQTALSKPGQAITHLNAMARCWSEKTRDALTSQEVEAFHRSPLPHFDLSTQAVRLMLAHGWGSPATLKRFMEGKAQIKDPSGLTVCSTPVPHALAQASTQPMFGPKTNGSPWMVAIQRLCHQADVDWAKPYLVPHVHKGVEYACPLESSMVGSPEFFLAAARHQSERMPEADWLGVVDRLIDRGPRLLGDRSESEPAKEILASLMAFRAKSHVNGLLASLGLNAPKNKNPAF